MPIPKYASYIMLDMEPRQFLSNGGLVNAIVDTEAYVLGPRELDLIAIECSLDESGAKSFKKGYTDVLSVPELSQIRELYRYLFCLIEIMGPSYDYNSWVSMPHRLIEGFLLFINFMVYANLIQKNGRGVLNK
jgi:hypothetical protein